MAEDLLRDDSSDDSPIEAERYELSEAPRYQFELSRRDFCRALGGGLLVLLVLPGAAPGQPRQSGREGRIAREGGVPEEVGAWIRIGEDGSITAYTGKVEVGQNIRTSLAQAVADELRVPVTSVKMIMGDTGQTPYDRGTFGSQSTPRMAPQLRRAAAGAREALLDLAAQSWGVPKGELELRDAQVVHGPSKRSEGLGKLTAGKNLAAKVVAAEALTPVAKWTRAGQTHLKTNGRAIVTGGHQYPSDIRLPGMLYGKVLRPAAFEAELTALDSKEAAAIPGVVVVRDGNFAGVAAPTPELAEKALGALKAEWKTKAQPSEKELFDYLKKNPVEGGGGWGGRSGDGEGSVDAGLAAASTKLEASYTVAYIAHVPLEPRAAVAEWKDGNVTVWTGTQRPFGVRTELAQAFTIPEEKIRVIMPDAGSGYGGKHTGDAALEAARLAKAAGKPVKLVWTRDEEFTWAYFRPAGVIDIRSGATADGKLTAWEFHNWNSGGSGIQTPYAVANRKIEYHPTRYPLRQGSYRALAATANHFARECHMDELARALNLDPLEFRLRNLGEERVRAVLARAAEAFGWAKREKKPGRGYGLACGMEKGGFVANCVEVETSDAAPGIRVVRAVTVYDCGAVVNPEQLKNQVEGAVVQGLGGALFEAIRFENGKILNPSLRNYRVPRFKDMPVLQTILLDRKDQPSAGAGETPIVTIAPAIANAVFDAGGKRLRALPLQKA